MRGRPAGRGTPYVWGTAAVVAFTLVLLAGMLALIAIKGLGHFWPQDLQLVRTDEGEVFLGQPVAREPLPAAGAQARPQAAQRTQYRIGGRDLYGLDFRWIDDDRVRERARPEDAVALEREADGDLFGFIAGLQSEQGEPEATSLAALLNLRADARRTAGEIRRLEAAVAEAYGPLNDALRRLAARTSRLRGRPGDDPRLLELESRVQRLRSAVGPEVERLGRQIDALNRIDRQRLARIRLPDGRTHEVRLSAIMRAWQPNQMSLLRKLGHYAGGLWAFLSDYPREANTAGGIFPALYGTLLMVLVMTLAVVPLGVLAALYLHEYAGDGWYVRAVRLAVHNLAGVPSIVFGVFGLGFFIYFVGGGIDRLFFSDYLPSPTFGTGGLLWASLTLALLTVPVVIVATEEGLAAVPRAYRDGSLALGATRFQTLRRIVVPHALPGILTGVILAVSRGAGEVAPLMLTGVVPLTSEHPTSLDFPFLHLERKFMHLGFHIYDVGFQSPNVEAVKPLVYSTTLVLVLLVLLLNGAAILLRNRLRRKARAASL